MSREAEAREVMGLPGPGASGPPQTLPRQSARRPGLGIGMAAGVLLLEGAALSSSLGLPSCPRRGCNSSAFPREPSLDPCLASPNAAPTARRAWRGPAFLGAQDTGRHRPWDLPTSHAHCTPEGSGPT